MNLWDLAGSALLDVSWLELLLRYSFVGLSMSV